MIFVTGDCHADFHKFNIDSFPEQKEMTKDDYVIICGDFGGVWDYRGENKNENNTDLFQKPYGNPRKQRAFTHMD